MKAPPLHSQTEASIKQVQVKSKQHINGDIKGHKIIGHPHTNLQGVASCKQYEY